MAVIRDYYKVLVVKRSATSAEIKAAFRKKAQRYHPDHNPGKEEWANKRLAGIIEAYECLIDPARRRAYDRKLAAQQQMAAERSVARRRTSPTASQIMVDIMRHRATPSWARTVAFAYIFFEYYSRER